MSFCQGALLSKESASVLNFSSSILVVTFLFLDTRILPTSSTAWQILPHLGLCLGILPCGLLPVIQQVNRNGVLRQLSVSDKDLLRYRRLCELVGLDTLHFLSRLTLYPFLPWQEDELRITWIELAGSPACLGLTTGRQWEETGVGGGVGEAGVFFSPTLSLLWHSLAVALFLYQMS